MRFDRMIRVAGIAALGVWASAAFATLPRAQGELAHARALDRAGFPALAAQVEVKLLAAHPSPSVEVQAVSDLVALQARLQDPFLVPEALAAIPAARHEALPEKLRGAIRYFAGEVAWRNGEAASASKLLSTVPKRSAYYGRARYLLGVIASDPSHPDLAQALQSFRTVAALEGSGSEHARLRGLAKLAIARTLYAQGRYAKSAEAYRRIPIDAPEGPDALLEEGYARFRAGDPGGALGAVEALHAPQLEGNFTPESWLLDATIYYFDCLYAEARSALYAFHQRYAPTERTLTQLLARKVSPAEAYGWISTKSPLPEEVLGWVRNDGRLRRTAAFLHELRRERSRLPKGDDALVRLADQARSERIARAGALVRARVREAERRLRHYSDQAEVLRFESTKAEKELLEGGLDRDKILAHERLYRPGLPSASWRYWGFDGEFWTDELGAYRFTLANGCPTKAELANAPRGVPAKKVDATKR